MKTAGVGVLLVLQLTLLPGSASSEFRLAGGEVNAQLGQPPQQASKVRRVPKPGLTDHFDFYFHRSGRLISFLRRDATCAVLQRSAYGPQSAPTSPLLDIMSLIGPKKGL